VYKSIEDIIIADIIIVKQREPKILETCKRIMA